MSTFKKLLALTLALAMVLSVSAFAGYSADTYADADKIASDCEDAVELMYALEIMKGDGKNFNPEASVTRAEMAKMIYVILNYGDDDKAATYAGGKFFADVADGAWYEGYVNYAAATKLVQGRPDGTFGPMDPVTTAEAAKMLLTAIGYSAEAREYTGANWAKNVLSDAAIIGLLDGYKSNVNTFAPRQWIAVMMENALEAYTFTTMRPSFSGLLTSGDDSGVVTMGNKYYGIEVFTGVAMATKKTSLYTTSTYSKNGILFDAEYEVWDGDEYIDVQYDLEDTGLGVADLGQEFKVILVGGDVVSVRNTGVSVVAEAELRTLAAKTITGTSKNEESNKYEFTLDGMTAELGDANYIVLGNIVDGKVNADELTEKELYAQANGKTDNVPTEVKFIDTDADEVIDYVVYTEWYYGVVAADGTSRAYGDYVTIELEDGTVVEYNDDNNKRLYVDDVISCEDTLEKGNYVKMNGNHESGKIDVEVLPVVETTLDRVTNKGTYTLGGETYVTSDSEYAFGDWDFLVKKNVDETYEIVFDGDMLVLVKEPEAEPTTLDEINAQLCVVTDKTHHYYTGWTRAYAVEILTIDNETAQYVLEDQDEDIYDAINVVGEHECAEGEFVQYLYVFSIDDDEITLEPLAATEAGLKALDPNKDVINGVWAGDMGDWEVEDKIGDDEVVLENTFFVGMATGSDFEVKAMTLEEVEGLIAKDTHIEGLYDCGKYINTLVAGYIAADDFAEAEDESEGYLYLNEEVYYDKADEENMAEVTFADGTVKTIVISNDEAEVEEMDLYTLYAYTYSKLKDAYKLEPVSAEEANIEMTTEFNKKLEEILVDFEIDGEAAELVEGFINDSIYVKEVGVKKAQRYDLTDCVIAVKNITLDLDDEEDNTIEVSYDIEFVTLDELKEDETIFNDYEDAHDFYYSDFTWAEEDILYIEVYRVVDAAQDLIDAE